MRLRTCSSRAPDVWMILVIVKVILLFPDLIFANGDLVATSTVDRWRHVGSPSTALHHPVQRPLRPLPPLRTRHRRSDSRKKGKLLNREDFVESARYVVDTRPTSQPIMFVDDPETDSHVVNSMLVIKKKPAVGSVMYYGSSSLDNDENVKVVIPPNYQGYLRPIETVESPSGGPTYYKPPSYLGSMTTNLPSSSTTSRSFLTWGSGYVEYPSLPSSSTTTQQESSGNVWIRPTRPFKVVNNHNSGYVGRKPTLKPSSSWPENPSTQETANVWKQPTTPTPISGVISNHKQPLRPRPTKKSHQPSDSYILWTQGPYDYLPIKTTQPPTTTQKPKPLTTQRFVTFIPTSTEPTVLKKPVYQESDYNPPSLIVNNHKFFQNRYKPTTSTRHPHAQSEIISVFEQQQNHETVVDILGDRIKHPDTITSKWMTVLDPHKGTNTTVVHDKLIVAQRRYDPPVKITTSPPVQLTTTVVITSNPILTLSKNSTTKKPSKPSGMDSFPVAPVMDPWSNRPITSRPTYVSSKPGSVSKPTSTGSASSPPVAAAPLFPGFPLLNFLGTIFAPLVNKPLSSGTLNVGMQGIKAMQGFLRNSLTGAMFCFLPSALIALSLSATQRAELRKTPEINEMMKFCKKCLENLNVGKDDKPKWLERLERD